MTPPTNRVELTEALVREHQAAVWRYLRALGCPPGEAEDHVHDAFVALHGAGLTDPGPAGVRGWLKATARNGFFASHRRAQRAPTVLADLDAAVAAYEGEDDGASYRDALRGCIEALPPRSREVLHLRYQAGADRAGIAAAADVGPEGAKTLLRRIKQHLRTCIERKLHHEPDAERSRSR